MCFIKDKRPTAVTAAAALRAAPQAGSSRPGPRQRHLQPGRIWFHGRPRAPSRTPRPRRHLTAAVSAAGRAEGRRRPHKGAQPCGEHRAAPHQRRRRPHHPPQERVSPGPRCYPPPPPGRRPGLRARRLKEASGGEPLAVQRPAEGTCVRERWAAMLLPSCPGRAAGRTRRGPGTHGPTSATSLAGPRQNPAPDPRRPEPPPPPYASGSRRQNQAPERARRSSLKTAATKTRSRSFLA